MVENKRDYFKPYWMEQKEHLAMSKYYTIALCLNNKVKKDQDIKQTLGGASFSGLAYEDAARTSARLALNSNVRCW